MDCVNAREKMNKKIVICVFACVTIEKYRLQVDKINETWGARAKLFEFVEVLFFLGEEQTAYQGEQYVYIPRVQNDYLSATYKQNLGLKYVYEKYKCMEFVFVCGTDTYINIDRLVYFLSFFRADEKIYIGGHGTEDEFNKQLKVKQHYGGAGFILTRKCVSILYPLFDDMTRNWIYLCKSNDQEKLIPCCDYCIALHAKLFDFTMETYVLHFYECNHKGMIDVSGLNGYYSIYECCVNKMNHAKLISCHNMSLEDFDEFTEILVSNNYFM
jgi:hypothetical protein